MKTTVDIPDDELQEAMRHLGVKTKKEAVVAAIEELNRRRRIAWLVQQMGRVDEMMTPDELREMREEG